MKILALFASVLVIAGAVDEHDALRVAIVGGGMSGCAAAERVREVRPEAEITLFERDARLGGRSTVVSTRLGLVEMGGSIFHEVNRHMMDAATRFTLTKVKAVADGERFGLFDGRALALDTSPHRFLAAAQMLWRYGLAPVHAEAIAQAAVDRFVRLYEPHNLPFSSVAEAISLVEFDDEVRWASLSDYLEARCGIDAESRFTREFMAGITLNNYGQLPSEMHAFSGLVALVGSGESLYYIEEGNCAVAEAMARASGAQVRLESTVTRVRRGASNNDFVVHWEHKSNSHEARFDIVIIAHPLEMDTLTVSDVHAQLPPRRDFQRTFVTLVDGTPNATFFGKTAVHDIPEMILATDSDVHPQLFRSFSRVRCDNTTISSVARSCLWKIFSATPLSRQTIRTLFVDLRVEPVVRDWTHAYPRLRPLGPDLTAPFALAPALFYTSAFESFVSTMETQIMAGRNVAELLHQLKLKEEGRQEE